MKGTDRLIRCLFCIGPALRALRVPGMVVILIATQACQERRAKVDSNRDRSISNLVVALSQACYLRFKEPQVVNADLSPAPGWSSSYTDDPSLNALMKRMESEFALSDQESIVTTKCIVYAEVVSPRLVNNRATTKTASNARYQGAQNDPELKYILSDCASPVVIQLSPRKMSEEEFEAEWLVVTDRRVVKFDIQFDGGDKGWTHTMTQVLVCNTPAIPDTDGIAGQPVAESLN